MYTISAAAAKIGLTAHTLRYYDKEGLLPFVNKSASGARLFKETDFEWLAIIECLKQTGLPLQKIKQFIDWAMQGDTTLKQRYKLFLERKAEVEKQIQTLRQARQKILYKCWYYRTALAAGTSKIHEKSLEQLAKERYFARKTKT
ncbi:transcriptional regulator MerR family [Candidatus Termititenax persephonae]|uniref:Transcriptional regulator MerR family n=1 Tax=Candidatus Termititenax persephonae TaxID=2218525 RepID=A0A388TG25_9BACT|nr:transcriptional regulator MerR family [Candidatus Termititenax persephonae]